jgi:hypothetical protein
MTTEELFALAVSLASEDLLGEGERVLSKEDIFSVLEALQERGLDLNQSS